MTNTTPGQWAVKQQATDTPELPGSEQHALVAHKPSGSLVAIIAMKGNAAVDNANAALIAAAPDMLFALRKFLAWAECDDALPPVDIDACMHYARAAIARAEGVQP